MENAGLTEGDDQGLQRPYVGLLEMLASVGERCMLLSYNLYIIHNSSHSVFLLPLPSPITHLGHLHSDQPLHPTSCLHAVPTHHPTIATTNDPGN